MGDKSRKTTPAFLLCAVATLLIAQAQGQTQRGPVSVTENDAQITLSNDFVELVFDRHTHAIVRLAADHNGARQFAGNLLAPDGIRFNDGGSGNGDPAKAQVVWSRPESVRLRLSWFPAGTRQAEPEEVTLTLDSENHGAEIAVVFPETQRVAQERGVHVALLQWFLLGVFDRGVVQYVAGQRQMFASRDKLRLFYTIDRDHGSVAIEPDPGGLAESWLLSADSSFASGIDLRSQPSLSKLDAWLPVSLDQPVAPFAAGKQRLRFRLYANDLPFPAHRAQNMFSGSAAARADSAAYFTAVYGSAAGVLGSYSERGSAFPTLATPERPYGDAFDFFDPDAWSTVTALSYSGDPLLQTEARRILERSESQQLPDGQIPHHFENGVPTFVSIAKSRQTGPNIFWVIAASEYAAGTGDEAWLRANYPHLKQATTWILAKYDHSRRLLRADGPLFIDVFRRDGFTLDTNVAALYLLNRMVEVAEFCGDSAGALQYRKLGRELSSGIRDGLWDGSDHFLTQRNPDGSTRDLVDYDANFGALAFGVIDGANAQRLLQRLDSGPHLHPGMHGTWVSEKRYQAEDSYGGNDGDSDVTMARIWWLDMAARVRMRDRKTFEQLLDQVESDLLRQVWLPERYDADGKPAHNDYYHEYPDILSIVLREMRYGVHVGMREVSVRPFDSSSFELRLGALHVSYSQDAVSLTVLGSTEREVVVGGLHPRTRYASPAGTRILTDEHGDLHIRARAGRELRLRMVH